MHAPCVFQDLGILEYRAALDRQIRTRAAKIADHGVPDYLFVVQHPPVFTLGRRGGRDNLMVSDRFLSDRGIEVIQTDRGGDITYHGPGQIVLYPVIDLERRRLGVADFVHGLEEIMCRTAASVDVTIRRNPRNHGVWWGDRKIGSVGLSIQRGITIHGLALNVTLDMTPFTWIHPCGLSDVSMTSLSQAVGEGTAPSPPHLSLKEVQRTLVDCFYAWFPFQRVENTAERLDTVEPEETLNE